MSKNEKNVYSSRIDMLEKENALLKRKLQRYEGDPAQEDPHEELRKI